MPTLPPFLLDTHKLYKEDTNRVVTWLAETAQKCGYSLTDGPPATRRPGRLKGKARQAARELERGRDADTSTPAVRRSIPVNELTDLAHSIAKHKPRVKVPQVILRLLDRAISLRKQCADWFLKNVATEEGVSDNSKHWHFIGVLESTLHILHPKSGVDTDSKPQSKNATPSMNIAAESEGKLVNMYDALCIDDSDDDSSAIPTAATPTASRTKTPSQPHKVVYEAESAIDDVYFTLFCFLNDLKQLRQFLRNLWQQYDAGTLDLMTVSMTTNTAINLVRRAEQDHFDTAISQNIIKGVVSRMSQMILSAWDDPDNNDFADRLYILPCFIIHEFLKKIKNHTVVMGRTRCNHEAEPSSHQGYGDIFLEGDKDILLRGLAEFSSWIKYGYDGLPVVDELMDGLSSAFVEQTVPLWLAYAGQIFVDIHNVLGKNGARCFSELHATARQIASTIKEYCSDFPDSGGLRSLEELLDEWLPGDDSDADVSEHIADDSIEPMDLFKCHPVLCGVFQFKLYTFIQHLSLEFINVNQTVLMVAHLYEACRQGGYLTQIWPDMELFMNIHVRERMFAGRIPQTPAESLKCLQLMMGVSPTQFANTNRRTPLRSKTRKELSFNSPVMNLFHKQWVERGDTILTITTVEGVLPSQQSTSTPQSTTVPGDDQSWMQKVWPRGHKMTPLQFLDILPKAISAEEHIFRFDYISLHVRCLQFLDTLQNVLDRQLAHHYGAEYIKNPPSFIIYYIIEASAFRKKHVGFEGSMLKKAREILAAYIEQEGSFECDKLEKRCLHWTKNKLIGLQSEKTKSGIQLN